MFQKVINTAYAITQEPTAKRAYWLGAVDGIIVAMVVYGIYWLTQS